MPNLDNDDGVGEITLALRSSIRSTLGYLFILAWWFYFKIVRLWVAPRLPPILLFASGADFILVAAEKLAQMHDGMDKKVPAPSRSVVHGWIDALIDAAARVWPFNDWLIWFTIATLAAAFIMYWHHDRVIKREQKYLLLLASLGEITEAATRLVISQMDLQASQAFVGLAVQVLETTARLSGDTSVKAHGLKRSATVWEMRKDEDSFLPWSSNTGDSLWTLPVSTASKALEFPKAAASGADKGLVYIPWTYFPHGTRHWVDGKKPRLEYIPNAFVDDGKQPSPGL